MVAQFELDLASDLATAQASHAKCVVNAKRTGLDAVETCSLTAKAAAEAWKDWSRYRAPFKAESSLARLDNLTPKPKEA